MKCTAVVFSAGSITRRRWCSSCVNLTLWLKVLHSHICHTLELCEQVRYIYEEIFVRRCYSRHGVRVRNGDTVIDAGANVGLFTLFLLRGGAIGSVAAHLGRQLQGNLQECFAMLDRNLQYVRRLRHGLFRWPASI